MLSRKVHFITNVLAFHGAGRISVKVFVLLAFLASTAAELSCSEQADALAASKAENEQLNSLVARLKSEIEQLKSGAKLVHSLDDLDVDLSYEHGWYNTFQLVNLTSPTDCLRKSKFGIRKGRRHNRRHQPKAWCKKGEGHCQKKCYVPKERFDKNCKMSDEFTANIEHRVVFNGKKESPAWSIMSGDPKKGRKNMKKLVNVRCPCTGSNGGMDQIEATQKIVGEVASIGVPEFVAKAVLREDKDWRHWGVTWNARIALSVIKMVSCWKKHCSKSSTGMGFFSQTMPCGGDIRLPENERDLDRADR